MKPPPPPPRPPRGGEPMRLNRFLAQCGVASRRASEELITAGKVSINGKVVTDLATQVTPEDFVRVDGERIEPRKHFVYVMMHKPKGVDVTRGDPHSEQNVFELLPPTLPKSVQAVGRLDRQTTGLLILTSDGDLAYRMTHPRYGLAKEYMVFGKDAPTPQQIDRLLCGVTLDDGPARAESVEIIPPEPNRGPALMITIREGRNRIIRRMCDAVGFGVARLHRTRMGPIQLGQLRRGDYRVLTASEVSRLRKAVGLAETPDGNDPPPPPPARPQRPQRKGR